MRNNFFSYGKHQIDSRDINAVTKSLKSVLSQGPQLINFEKKVAKYFGAKYCVAVSSATAALHIAIASMGLKKDTLCYTTDMTFVATTNACLYNDLKINILDIDPDNNNLNLSDLENKLKKLSKSKQREKKLIIPVHFAGLPVDMERINRIKKKYNCYVLEDSSQAMGSKFKDNYIGNCKYSDFSVFSLHPVKSITTGEGGLITTNNKNFYEKLKLLRAHGLLKDKKNHWKNNMIFLGFNYKITDFQCALGISQLSKLKRFISKRNRIANFYKKKLRHLNIEFQEFDNKKFLHSYHYFIIKFKKKISKKKNIIFINFLKNKKIFLGKQYLPIHRHNFYKNKIKGNFKNADEYFNQSFQIPIYTSLTQKNLDYICENILNTCKRMNM